MIFESSPLKSSQNILFRFGDSNKLLFALPNSSSGHDRRVLLHLIRRFSVYKSVGRRGKHIFNMSQRFHRGMVEQYKGRKVVTALSTLIYRFCGEVNFAYFSKVFCLMWLGFAFSGELFCVCRPLSVEQGGGDEGCARSLCFHHPQVR